MNNRGNSNIHLLVTDTFLKRSYSSSMAVRNYWILAGTWTCCRTRRSRASQTCSMGDMSDEYAGHGRTGTFSASRHCVQILVTWGLNRIQYKQINAPLLNHKMCQEKKVWQFLHRTECTKTNTHTHSVHRHAHTYHTWNPPSMPLYYYISKWINVTVFTLH